MTKIDPRARFNATVLSPALSQYAKYMESGDSDDDEDDLSTYIAAVLVSRRRAAAAARKRQKSGPQGKKRRPLSSFSWDDHTHCLSERGFKLRYRVELPR